MVFSIKFCCKEFCLVISWKDKLWVLRRCYGSFTKSFTCSLLSKLRVSQDLEGVPECREFTDVNTTAWEISLKYTWPFGDHFPFLPSHLYKPMFFVSPKVSFSMTQNGETVKVPTGSFKLILPSHHFSFVGD